MTGHAPTRGLDFYLLKCDFSAQTPYHAHQDGKIDYFISLPGVHSWYSIIPTMLIHKHRPMQHNNLTTKSTQKPHRKRIQCLQQHRFALRAEMKRTLILATPLIGAYLLQMSNGLVDTLVAGRLGRDQLAGVGIGSSLWLIVFLSSVGLMAGLSPTMARAIGQSRQYRVGAIFQQGCWLAAILALINLSLLTWLSSSIVDWGFETQLALETQHYLNSAKWGIVPAVLMLPARNVCEATGRTTPILLIQLAGIVVNTFSDLGFGLGWFGLPALGLAGIGWSTTLVMLTMSLCLLWFMQARGYKRYQLFAQREKIDGKLLRQLLALSAPICLTMLFEAGLFTATALQMGFLGPLATSAHNVAIGVTAFFYMMPLGLSFALTARVGVAMGRGAYAAVKLRVLNGVLITILMALCSSVILLLLRQPIAALYTPDPEVQKLAATLLVFAAIFQISDDLQVTLLGMLRGLHDTRVPMLINAFSYWVIAAGFGYFAAHYLGMGPYGLWLGLIIGLSLSAGLLSFRLVTQLRKLHRQQQPNLANNLQDE